MARIFLCQFFIAVSLVGALACGASRADPPLDKKEKPLAPAEKIRKTFDEKITIEIADQPLYLALNQLRDQSKINFVLDRQTLQNMGQDPDALPVNIKKKQVTVREALQAIVKPYNLHYAIVGDAVIISTDEMATLRQLRQHITVDLQKVELAAALKQLKLETGGVNINLVPENAKEGKTLVTLQMDDVPLETAVRLLAEMAGMKVIRDHNVLQVVPRAKAAEMRKEAGVQPGGTGDIELFDRRFRP